MRNVRWLIVSAAIGFGLAAAAVVASAAGAESPASPGVEAEAAGIGSPFPIITVISDHVNAVVAYDEGRNRSLVVWEGPSNSMGAACVEADGSITRYYVVGSGIPSNPDVVYSPQNDQYLIVYDTGPGGQIEGQFIVGTCCIGCGGAPFVISDDRPNTENGPAVAYNHHDAHRDYLVVWTDTDNTDYGIYARQVLSFTQKPNPSFPITYTSGAYNYEPDVAYNLNRNEYLVVYTHDDGGPTDPDIYGTLVKNAGGVGVLAENVIDSSPNAQEHASVSAYRLNCETPYLVAFSDEWNDPSLDVRAYLVLTTGVPVQLVNIDTVPGRTETLVDLAASEPLGGHTAVWMAHNGNDFDVYWRRIESEGQLGPILPVAAVYGKDERYPSVAGGSPAPMAVWQEEDAGGEYDVYGRLLWLHVYLPLVLRD